MLCIYKYRRPYSFSLLLYTSLVPITPYLTNRSLRFGKSNLAPGFSQISLRGIRKVFPETETINECGKSPRTGGSYSNREVDPSELGRDAETGMNLLVQCRYHSSPTPLVSRKLLSPPLVHLMNRDLKCPKSCLRSSRVGVSCRAIEEACRSLPER